ncbi:hypothetical protein [Pararhodospirillum photometricum]|uniref:DUF1795 domain-containing protein n=1 Tax=Pararhodospirillum photometricum DSM 122 TaxID=1150469 RepID=H6SMN7_PARPM|nr:hypothetical protein [Pararhodospirillum photometricum]CCG09172.1 Putative uncharacterized protein [Pararhodospirillum photometricum DSM 122]
MNPAFLLLALALGVPLVGIPTADAKEAPAKPGRTLAEAQPPGLGVHFRYPASWRLEKVDGHTVLLSGAPETPEWLTTVTLTNQENPDSKNPQAGAATLVAQYVAAIRARGTDQEILREAPFTFPGSGPAGNGQQAVARFQGQNGPVRQWMVAIPRADMAVALVVLYTAPDDAFEKALPTAQAVVDGMSFLPQKGKKK